MKKHLVWLIFLPCALVLHAQRTSLELQEAYVLLEEQYPSLKNSAVLENLYQRKRENIDKGRLPALYLKGDGRLQSENLTIEGEPGAPFEFSLPLYSARGYLEVQYDLLNGKVNNTRQAIEANDLQADLQEIEVDRHALKQRVNELFINITLLRAQVALLQISANDLDTRLEQVQARIENGAGLQIEADKIRVATIELRADIRSLEEQISGMTGTLEMMTGTDLTPDVELRFPELGPPEALPEMSRPEKDLFQLQRESLLARADLIDLERRPQLGVFAQGGVGYPNPVNLFDTGFAPYGIIGVNFAWKITDWKKGQIDKEVLRLQAKQLQHAEETFDFNIRTGEQKYLAEIRRIKHLMQTDEAVASLQSEILGQMLAQLEEGTITSADYLAQANAELRARQSLALHEMQLLQVQLEFWNTRGSL